MRNIFKRGTRVAFEGRADDIGTVTSWHPSWGNNVDAVRDLLGRGYVPVRFPQGVALFHVSRLCPFCEVR